MITFNDKRYYDDRLFVLRVCQCTIHFETEPIDSVITTIYHENAPSDSVWCLVTYRNCDTYPIERVDHFQRKEDALAYLKSVEPQTPLISLRGAAPDYGLSYDGAYNKYLSWKEENKDKLKKFELKSLHNIGRKGVVTEVSIQTRESFKGIMHYNNVKTGSDVMANSGLMTKS